MIGSSLILAVMVLVGLVFVFMDELAYLAPHRNHLVSHYATLAALFAGVVFANVFATFYTLNRKFFLKDAGRRLSHLDKQIKTQQSDLSSEIHHKFHE